MVTETKESESVQWGVRWLEPHNTPFLTHIPYNTPDYPKKHVPGRHPRLAPLDRFLRRQMGRVVGWAEQFHGWLDYRLDVWYSRTLDWDDRMEIDWDKVPKEQRKITFTYGQADVTSIMNVTDYPDFEDDPE